jgi:hypothetical protein
LLVVAVEAEDTLAVVEQEVLENIKDQQTLIQLVH